MTASFQRDVFIDILFDAAKKDESIMFLSADFGAPSLDKFRDELPKQFIHCGISEQHMIDMAAGLSMSGHKVYVYAMAPFVTLRCLEQIKCSLALMSLPVTIIAVGVGLGYADSGPTHYLNEDIACMRSIVGLDVIAPSDKTSTEYVANLTLTDPKLRIVRLERNALDELYPKNEKFNEDGFNIISNGKEISLITYGYMTHRAKEACELLKKENIEVGLIDIYSIKPFPKNLISNLSNLKKIITIEEQTLSGGFGSSILENLSLLNLLSVEIKNMGLPDKYFFENGGREYLLDQNGLSVKDIINQVKN